MRELPHMRVRQRNDNHEHALIAPIAKQPHARMTHYQRKSHVGSTPHIQPSVRSLHIQRHRHAHPQGYYARLDSAGRILYFNIKTQEVERVK